MKYRKLGASGLNVSAVGMGCMPLSVGRDRPAEREAIAVIRHAASCGVTFFDTADSYCRDDSEPGHNERLLGKALREMPPSERERIVVATKGGLVRPEGRWERDGRPEHLREVVDASLENLGVDCIQLYQHHRIDPNVPLEESLKALAEFRRAGKIAHIGVSNYSVDEIRRGAAICPIVSVQNQYAPDHRQPEFPAEDHDRALDPDTAGTLEFTANHNMAFLPWCPLGGMGSAKRWGDSGSPLARLSNELGVSPYQLVVAWHLCQGGHVIPIPGASRAASIEDSAKAADLDLDPKAIEALRSALESVS